MLPVFRKQGAGHLVVVNSLLGQVAAPLMGSYVAAKWGQLGLVRVLQQETRDEPGHLRSRSSSPAASTPRSTSRRRPGPAAPAGRRRRSTRRSGWPARCVARWTGRGREVQAGIFNPLITAGFRLVPGVYDFLVGPLLQRMAIADDDVPPTEGNVFASQPAGNATEGRWRSI